MSEKKRKILRERTRGRERVTKKNNVGKTRLPRRVFFSPSSLSLVAFSKTCFFCFRLLPFSLFFFFFLFGFKQNFKNTTNASKKKNTTPQKKNLFFFQPFSFCLPKLSFLPLPPPVHHLFFVFFSSEITDPPPKKKTVLSVFLFLQIVMMDFLSCSFFFSFLCCLFLSLSLEKEKLSLSRSKWHILAAALSGTIDSAGANYASDHWNSKAEERRTRKFEREREKEKQKKKEKNFFIILVFRRRRSLACSKRKKNFLFLHPPPRSRFLRFHSRPGPVSIGRVAFFRLG